MSVRDRIKSMNKSTSTGSLETVPPEKRVLKTRNSDMSSRTPMQLPGMAQGM